MKKLLKKVPSAEAEKMQDPSGCSQGGFPPQDVAPDLVIIEACKGHPRSFCQQGGHRPRKPYGKCRIKKAPLRGVRNSQNPTRPEIEVETEAGSSLA